MSNLQKPFVDGISRHVQMSTGMSEDKFLELQQHKCLPSEVMINPLISWFSLEGVNYPVGALEWAENFVEGDITIYSTIFHQPYQSSVRRHDCDVKSGSVSLVSVIAITVAKVGLSKEVKVEMTVGHDKIMIITNEKLILKDKHSNKVFEFWYRSKQDGILIWKKTNALRGVVSEANDSFPPAFLSTYGERMISFISSQLMHSAEDLRLFRDKMNKLLKEAKAGGSISIASRTPDTLERAYYHTVDKVLSINKSMTAMSEINELIEQEFEQFIECFRKYLSESAQS